MGNYKFRLSDMIPNAWFYKLKDMSQKGNKSQSTPQSATRSHQQPASRTASSLRTPKPKPLPVASQPKLLPNRASYYYSSRVEAEDGHRNHALHSKAVSDAEFLLLDPLRRSKKRGGRKPGKASASNAKLVTSSVSAGCSCRSWKGESVPEFPLPPSPESPPCPRDYYIDGEQPNLQDTNVNGGLQRNAIVYSASELAQKLDDPDMAPERELPPILTKPAKKQDDDIKLEHKIPEDKTGSYQACSPAVRQHKSHTRRSPPGLHRLRMRANSPRLASRKLQSHHRDRKSGATAAASAAMQQKKAFSSSFAVVKSSSDPQRDFRDSMVEMIVENDMRTTKDLEELLACYLLLNSKEYHDVIVEVFEQLWFDLITNVKL